MYPVIRLQIFLFAILSHSRHEGGHALQYLYPWGGLFDDKRSRNGTEVACKIFPFVS